MLMFSVVSKINTVIADLSAVDIIPGTDYLLKEDLGFDSLKIVELLINIEDAFAISFLESDLDPNKINRLTDLYILTSKYAG